MTAMTETKPFDITTATVADAMEPVAKPKPSAAPKAEAAQVKAEAARVDISDYVDPILRPDVTGFLAYWQDSRPTVHSSTTKCMKHWDDLEIRDLKWFEAAADTNKRLAAHGEKPTSTFCTRCVLVKPEGEAAPLAERAASAARAARELDDVTGQPLEIHGEPCPTCFVEMSIDGLCSTNGCETAMEQEKLLKPVTKVRGTAVPTKRTRTRRTEK